MDTQLLLNLIRLCWSSSYHRYPGKATVPFLKYGLGFPLREAHSRLARSPLGPDRTGSLLAAILNSLYMIGLLRTRYFMSHPGKIYNQ